MAGDCQSFDDVCYLVLRPPTWNLVAIRDIQQLCLAEIFGAVQHNTYEDGFQVDVNVKNRDNEGNGQPQSHIDCMLAFRYKILDWTDKMTVVLTPYFSNGQWKLKLAPQPPPPPPHGLAPPILPKDVHEVRCLAQLRSKDKNIEKFVYLSQLKSNDESMSVFDPYGGLIQFYHVLLQLF